MHLYKSQEVAFWAQERARLRTTRPSEDEALYCIHRIYPSANMDMVRMVREQWLHIDGENIRIPRAVPSRI